MTPQATTSGTISHRPFGSGHPYRIDPDQRHPVQLVGGDPYQLRVLAAPNVTSIDIEYGDGVQLPLKRASIDEMYGNTCGSAEGHLAAASGARPDVGDQVPWRVVGVAPASGSLRYRFLTAGERVTTQWFETPVGVWQPAGGEVVTGGGSKSAERLGNNSADWLVTDAGPVRVRVALRLDDGEHVVGFGERFDALDQRGSTLDAVVFEQYKHQGQRTYLPSPFAIVTGGERPGWGFHVRTSRRVWFDIGATDAAQLRIELSVDPSDPVVELRFYDGAPADVLGEHVAETGGLRRPPDWVFAPWMSGNDWNTQARVLGEVERSVALGVPVGAVVIEAWSDESTFTAFRDARYEVQPGGEALSLIDFDFPDDGAWPDPAAMVERLHELGVKVLLWQIPLVPTDRGADGQVGADAARMVESRYCVAEADGTPYRNRGWWFPGALLPDWTNPSAGDWWLAKRRYLLTDVGIDGFKTDGGEHAWGDELRYADGTRGDVSNNLFAQRYADAYTALLDDCDVNGVTFSRAGFTGAGSSPCHWAGDEDSTWKAFRASITAGLTAGASGVAFWGWDLAGFSGEIPSVELYVRSSAMATFCPIMQYHSEFSGDLAPHRDRTPWNIAERHDDARALTLYRRFAVLRARLQPYLIEQADVSIATGVPMMRALCFGFPRDPTVWEHPLQYQFGDHLLVAPVCHENDDSVDVYLPAGRWVDAWTGEQCDGGRVVRRPVPWHEIAVFIDAAHAARLLLVFADLPDGLVG